MTTTIEPKIAQVLTTSDYSMFKLIKSNRAVSNKHVQALIASFQDNPQLVATRPIIVNERMEVIDGQHRLLAVEALGWVVHYIVAPGLDIATAQLMNVLQKSWTIMDYVRSYALSGNEDYARFQAYADEYPIAWTPLAVYLSGGRAHNLSRIIRTGSFKIDPDTARVDRDLSCLADFGPFVPEWETYGFALAVWGMFQVPNYNHDRMISQLEARKPDRQPSRLMWLRELERTYNYNKTSTNQLRFF